MDDLLVEFLAETQESLSSLDSGLLRLERAPQDEATIAEVFRHVHTIKGTCGFLGLPRLERVAHATENVLGRYRDGTLAVSVPGISLLFAALDAFRDIVGIIQASGAEPEGADDALIEELGRLADGKPARRIPPPHCPAP